MTKPSTSQRNRLIQKLLEDFDQSEGLTLPEDRRGPTHRMLHMRLLQLEDSHLELLAGELPEEDANET